MDYEKKYKNALEWARQVKGGRIGFVLSEVEKVFPELAESEDEKIKREFCEDIWTFIPNEKAHKYIAWLEKQGEKKPVEEYNSEDFGIDSLYHAQRILEKTLGEVEGYQSDDGILEHKCAISAVK